MAKTIEPAFIDTNILLEASNTERRYCDDATRLLERHRQLFMSAQVIREFLVVATRSVSKNGLGLPLSVALKNLEGFRRNIRLLPEEKPILSRFLELLAKGAYFGNHLHDVHLVATALAHKLPILVTLNTADFVEFEEQIRVMTPRQLL